MPTKAEDIAASLQEPSETRGVLMDEFLVPPMSHRRGAENLIAMGLWNMNGKETELGAEVRELLQKTPA